MVRGKKLNTLKRVETRLFDGYLDSLDLFVLALSFASFVPMFG